MKDRDLKRLGITKAEDLELKPRITVGIESYPMEKAGKTTWAFGGPGPYGVLSNDPMTRGVVKKMQAEGKEILFKEFPECEDKKEAVKQWSYYMEVYQWMLANCRSVIIDTDTGAWSLQRLALLGKLEQVPPNLYVTANREKRRMMRMAEGSNACVFFIYKRKKQYVTEMKRNSQGIKKEVSTWKGDYERAGFRETGNLLMLNVEIIKIPATEELDIEERFKVKIINCTETAEMDGMTFEYPINDFVSLATMIYPESDEEDWQ